MNSLFTLVAAAGVMSLLAAGPVPARAAPAEAALGPYLGVGLGASGFGTADVRATKLGSDERDTAGKFYGGWQLTENFGIELGYVRLGTAQYRFDVGGTAVEQSAKGRSVYLAATGRLPLGDSFALTGRLGVARNKVSGSNRLGAVDSLIGSKTNPMLGFGVEYRMGPSLALTVDLDGFGKLSNRLSGSVLTVGTRFSF